MEILVVVACGIIGGAFPRAALAGVAAILFFLATR